MSLILFCSCLGSFHPQLEVCSTLSCPCNNPILELYLVVFAQTSPHWRSNAGNADQHPLQEAVEGTIRLVRAHVRVQELGSSTFRHGNTRCTPRCSSRNTTNRQANPAARDKEVALSPRRTSYDAPTTAVFCGVHALLQGYFPRSADCYKM